MLYRTYRYRLKDRRSRKFLRAQAWAVNQVWNWCVAQQRDTETRYRAGAKPRKWATGFDLGAFCNGVGKELGILQSTVQTVCNQFAKSRDQHRRAPRFRASSGPRRALGWVPFHPEGRRIDGNSVIYRGTRHRWFGNKCRPLPETVKGGCFVEDALGRWWVCFTVEVEADLVAGEGHVGIDLGLKNLATLSDGSVIEAPQYFRRLEDKLATAQRAGNRRRARAIHIKIKNCRGDFIHKATARLVRENRLIAVGNVSSARLGRTRLAKSVFDAGWSMFRAQLAYKSASRRQAAFLTIDESFTTQTCSSCGSLPPERPRGITGLGIRSWDCSDCGASHDRDVNAARNILAVALSAQRRGDESRKVANG